MARSFCIVLLLVGCDAAGLTRDAGLARDAAEPFDGASPPDLDAGVPLHPDAGPAGGDGGPPVRQLVPCATGSCWDTALSAPRCLSRGIDEDFSSGRYNVHRWAISLWAGAETTLRVERTGGGWQPALIVTESDGTVLYDGARGTEREGLAVVPVSDGRSGPVAELRISSDRDVALSVHVTAWAIIDSGFAPPMPTSASYRFEIVSACEGRVTVPCVVNGHAVDEPACGWLHYVGREVVPRLEGTRDEALTAAARVAWWSLKEGVLFLDNPIVYSNCNTSSGDRRIGPLDVCEPGRAWQVGSSGVQVPGRDLAGLEATAERLFRGLTSDEVLDRTAREASVDDVTRAAIVASGGDLRRSWLLRASPVGFTFQAPTVTRECVDSTRTWCYGTRWRETQLFAPDRAAALGAIEDVRAILDAVAP